MTRVKVIDLCDYWRVAHTRYFSQLGRYSPDMMLGCERFELVERIG
jgi:uncharacterized protein YhfF